MAKVIHIHLTHGIEGTKRKDWYFSSITAIYTVLTAEQVGATKNYLLHAGLSGNGTVLSYFSELEENIQIEGIKKKAGGDEAEGSECHSQQEYVPF